MTLKTIVILTQVVPLQPALLHHLLWLPAPPPLVGDAFGFPPVALEFLLIFQGLKKMPLNVSDTSSFLGK